MRFGTEGLLNLGSSESEVLVVGSTLVRFLCRMETPEVLSESHPCRPSTN
jgi:hypothetical protein